MIYKIFTVASGRATPGAEVEPLALKGAGVTIPAVTVGERGRGRELAVLPVDGATPAPAGGYERLLAAEVGQTRTGRPKLIARAPEAATQEAVILVLRTHIGYRGSNIHTGDALPGGQYWGPMPGQVLAQGYIAQGDAGRMGGGRQFVLLLPRGAVLRTAYSGRLYGGPSEHYVRWDGTQLLVLTREERELSGVF